MKSKIHTKDNRPRLIAIGTALAVVLLLGAGAGAGTIAYRSYQKAQEEGAIAENLQDIYDHLTRLDEAVVNNQYTLGQINTGDYAGLMGESSTLSGDYLQGNITDLDSKMRTLHSNITKVRESLSGVKDTIGDQTFTSDEQTASRVLLIGSSLDEISSNLDTAMSDIQTIINYLNETDLSQYEALAKTLSEVQNNLSESKSKNVVIVDDKLKNLTDYYITSVNRMQRELDSNILNLNKTIESEMASVSKDTSDKMSSISDSTSRQFDASEQNINNQFSEANSNLNRQFSSSNENINNKVDQTNRNINESFLALTNSQTSKFTDSIARVNSSFDQMSEDVNNRLASANNDITRSLSDTSGYIDSHFDSSVQSFEGMADNTKTLMDQGLNSTKTNITTFSNETGTRLSALNENIRSSLGIPEDTNLNNYLSNRFAVLEAQKGYIGNVLNNKHMDTNNLLSGDAYTFGMSDIYDAINNTPSTSIDASDNPIVADYSLGGSATTGGQTPGADTSLTELTPDANGYSLDLGVDQKVQLPAGYYDAPVVVNNTVQNNGSLNGILTSANNAITIEPGYYSGGTISADITSQPGTISYDHHVHDREVTDKIVNNDSFIASSLPATYTDSQQFSTPGGCYSGVVYKKHQHSAYGTAPCYTKTTPTKSVVCVGTTSAQGGYSGEADGFYGRYHCNGCGATWTGSKWHDGGDSVDRDAVARGDVSRESSRHSCSQIITCVCGKNAGTRYESEGIDYYQCNCGKTHGQVIAAHIVY